MHPFGVAKSSPAAAGIKAEKSPLVRWGDLHELLYPIDCTLLFIAHLDHAAADKQLPQLLSGALNSSVVLRIVELLGL